MADPYSGPVNYLVATFPAQGSPGEGLRELLDAVDRGAIEVLDLEHIGRDDTGKAIRRPLTDVHVGAETDLSEFVGIESDILDADDLASIAAGLEPGGFALALVYLEHGLDRTVRAWLDAGGRPLMSGTIDPDDLDAAVESATVHEEGP